MRLEPGLEFFFEQVEGGKSQIASSVNKTQLEMAAFFPLLQQLSRKRARQDTEQLQLWAAKRRRIESQMFLSQMNEEMEEAQVFARCGVLSSSNERKERGQNEPRDGSWWASLCKFCVKVVSIRSSRPYARGHQTSLRVKVID